MKKLIFLFAILAVLAFYAGCAGAPEAAMEVPSGSSTAEEEALEPPAAADVPVPPPAPEPEKDEDIRSDKKEAEAELSFVLEGDAPREAKVFGEAGTGARPVERPSESGLSASYADDNQQYGYFLTFLDEYKDAHHLELDVSERIIFTILDADGKPVPNALLSFSRGDGELVAGRTASDGSFLFFPRAWGDLDTGQFDVEVRSSAGSARMPFLRNGPRKQEVRLDRERIIPDPPPVDILFVLDTTGSMGEEIERLKTTIELIHLNLSSMPAAPAIRFGMVLYKDYGDEYRTKLVPLTPDLQAFQTALAPVVASGGGDTPEDLEYALWEGVERMDWNSDGIRLMFVITDAPPQIGYEDTPAAYTASAQRAQQEGIRIYSVGTGGLPLDGEYVLRQLSQFTGGRYIFLTYGEAGESEGGAPGSVSHHTGTNFQTDKLESIIIRFAKEEISNLTDKPLDRPEDYFQATRIDAEEREETLEKLFGQAVEQLADFSSLGFGREFPVAVLPLAVRSGGEDAALQAEYFGERLTLAAGASGRLTLVERRDLQSLMDELELQLSGITGGEGVAELGRLLNAEALISGTLFESAEGYEIFLRLLRVETGEVLSLTRARIDAGLGL
jgi:Mg-chelatase subunit ChlD